MSLCFVPFALSGGASAEGASRTCSGSARLYIDGESRFLVGEALLSYSIVCMGHAKAPE